MERVDIFDQHVKKTNEIIATKVRHAFKSKRKAH